VGQIQQGSESSESENPAVLLAQLNTQLGAVGSDRDLRLGVAVQMDRNRATTGNHTNTVQLRDIDTSATLPNTPRLRIGIGHHQSMTSLRSTSVRHATSLSKLPRFTKHTTSTSSKDHYFGDPGSATDVVSPRTFHRVEISPSPTRACQSAVAASHNITPSTTAAPPQSPIVHLRRLEVTLQAVEAIGGLAEKLQNLHIAAQDKATLLGEVRDLTALFLELFDVSTGITTRENIEPVTLL